MPGDSYSCILPFTPLRNRFVHFGCKCVGSAKMTTHCPCISVTPRKDPELRKIECKSEPICVYSDQPYVPLFNCFYFTCVLVCECFSVCISAPHLYIACGGQKKGVRSPGAGVTDGCKPHNLRTKLEVQRQYSLLLAEPSSYMQFIIIM